MKIAFLGAGRMSGAIIKGLLAQKVYRPHEIGCTSATGATARALSAETGILAPDSLGELLREASVVVAGFKPQQLAGIDPALASLTTGKLVLSILAGSRISALSEKFPGARNIVRVMPNTPGQIGAGISGYSFRDAPSDDDRKSVAEILGSLGEHLEVPEPQLDAVTAVSGSGPAYVFEFIASLRNGGVAAGLDRDVAQKLAVATVAGAARLVRETGTDPEVLRDRVTSPGGTTLAGLRELERHGFRPMILETVLAAKKRSEELSENG